MGLLPPASAGVAMTSYGGLNLYKKLLGHETRTQYSDEVAFHKIAKQFYFRS
jgi:hypothetical protein